MTPMSYGRSSTVERRVPFICVPMQPLKPWLWAFGEFRRTLDRTRAWERCIV